MRMRGQELHMRGQELRMRGQELHMRGSCFICACTTLQFSECDNVDVPFGYVSVAGVDFFLTYYLGLFIQSSQLLHCRLSLIADIVFCLFF